MGWHQSSNNGSLMKELELLKENNTMVEHVRVLGKEKGSQKETEKELRTIIEKHLGTIEKTEIENNKLKSEISLDQIKFKEITTIKETLEKQIHVIEADNSEHIQNLNESKNRIERLNEEKRSILAELEKHLN